MDLKKAEALWGRAVWMAAILGALFFGFTYVRDQQQDAEVGAEHRDDAHPETVKSLVEDLSQQRATDEDFRQQSLGAIRQGFENHGERITGLEDQSKETRFLIREQRTLRTVEQARLKQIESEQQASRTRDAAQDRRTLEAIEAVRDRPVEVIVPPAPPVAP